MASGRSVAPALADDPPLISIITAVLNGARSIEYTIRSMATQSYRNFEYIVLDAASGDGTAAVLERHAQDIDYWCSEPDAGIYDAWNKGLRRARGRWIGFLGAGDAYRPDALERYARYIADHDEDSLQFVSSRVELSREGRALATIGERWRWPDFARHMTVAHVGALHSRKLFERYGQFDPSYQICGDYELLLRAGAELHAGFLPEVMVSMEYGGVSVARPRAALLEAKRAKHTTGRRAAWRCALEYRVARAKALVRSVAR